MRSEARGRSANIAIAFLLATPCASALSLPSLVSPRLRHTRLSRRQDSNTTTIPAAISVGPSQYWDGNDGPWSSFPLQIGNTNNPQNIRAMPGTSVPSTVTIGSDGCPAVYPADCGDQRGFLFYPNQSLTWIDNSIFNLGVEVNLGLDTTADTGFDTVTLGWQGSEVGTVEHSVVYNLAAANFWIGIFGLNPMPTNFTTYNDPQPSVMQQLVNLGTIPSLTYGYTAGNQYRLNKVYGSLTLGGYDESRFDTTKNISVPFGSDVSRDLLVNLQSITTDSGSPSNLLPDGQIAIFIDSAVGQLWLPESACNAFEQAFGLTYDNSSNFYLVNSTLHDTLKETNANVTFTLGSQESSQTVDIVLPYGAFDLTLGFPNIMNPNTSYYFPLKRAANENQYTLGRTFLQEAYIIADYDRRNFTVAPCTWDSNTIASTSLKTITRANASSIDNGEDSGTPVGAIAGGVVGGVVALVLIIGAIIFFMRRKKQTEQKRLAELDDKSASGATGTKNSSEISEGKPFISAPIGGELGNDGQIHEAPAPHKPGAQEMDSPYKMDPNKAGYSEMQGSQEFFAPQKGIPAEMRGSTPIYEMAGSDVHEMPTPINTNDVKR